MPQIPAPVHDPYAYIRHKLRRVAPLTDLDKTLARADLDILQVSDGFYVRGLAIITASRQLQLYYADEAHIARELMTLLSRRLADTNFSGGVS